MNSEKNLLMRITKLQQANIQLRKELRDKNQRLQEYEKEVSVLKTIIEEEHLEHYNCIITQNEKLKQENQEIKTFLEDYGFKWLGSIDQMKSQNEEEKKKLFELMKTDFTQFQEPIFKTQIAGGGQATNLPIDEIRKKVDELNKKSEKSYAKRQNGTAIIDKDKPLILTLYRNGLKLGNFPYYPYFSKDGQELLSDIYDGYFPTKLKGKYFECTPIVFVDDTNQLYVPPIKKFISQAVEMDQQNFSRRPTLSKLRNQSTQRLEGSNQNLNTLISPREVKLNQNYQIAPDQQQQSLLSNRISLKHLKLVEKLKDQILPQIQEFAPEIIEVETEIYKLMKEHSANTFPRENLVEITVKSESKKRQLHIKMGKKEVISRLFDYAFSYRENQEVKNRNDFELRTIFPVVKFKHGDLRTFEELGFLKKKTFGFYFVPKDDQSSIQ
eukprot:403370666